MPADNRWTESRWVMLAAICALALSLAPLSAVSAAVQDTTGTAARDTTARAQADTSVAAREKALWTMEELKRVLGDETGGIREGKAYKDRKNGRVAIVCAVLIPGLGQMYNEKPLKAAIALGLESYYLSQIVMNRRMMAREEVIRDTYPAGSSSWEYHDRYVTEYWERSIDWIWWSGAVIFGIVIDAYVDAKLDDMRFKVEARASKGNVGVCLLVRY